MRAIDKEYELTTAAIIAAEEGWAKGYLDQPKQFKQLVRNAARLDRELTVYFHNLAKEVAKYIDWYAYARAVIEQRHQLQADAGNVQAYDVNVIVNQDAVNQQDQAFIKLVFDTIADTAAAGYASQQLALGLPISVTPTHTVIQELTTKQLANLVGMRINKDGFITPNPNPAYSIDETTRGKIARSIQTSIQLGEDQPAAAARLSDVIADPKRAETIARTETVRAYEQGRFAYAKASNAAGKVWQDYGAIDVCADNTSEGEIPLDQTFTSGDYTAPAHPNCKCRTIYMYNGKP